MTVSVSPTVFHPQLSDARLAIVAEMLLDELYATETDLVRDTDSGYTRGCTTFGRQRARLVSEALSGKYPWLELRTGANDVVFTIEGVPCRFSNDDSRSPSKDAVLSVSRYQADFLEFASQGEPGRFCFVIDRGYSEDQEPRVVFMGFSPSGAVVCQWESHAVRTLRRVDEGALLKSVELAKPEVKLKQSAATLNEGGDLSASK